MKKILENHPNLDTNDTSGTDKNSVHSYVSHFYEKAFSEYLNKNISLLEIGINAGGSLFLWKEYFGNSAKIIGIDIENKIKKEWKKDDIQYIFTDAYDLNLVKNLPKFDIIIDDGPHTIYSQIFAIKNYIYLLNKGGLMIIEDVQDLSHIDILKNNTPDLYKDSIEIVDLRHVKNRYDDLMFIIHG